MVRVREVTSNRNSRLGLAGGKAQKKMVRPSEETLNTLFDVFQDWQDHLRFVDFEEIDKKYQENLNDGEDE